MVREGAPTLLQAREACSRARAAIARPLRAGARAQRQRRRHQRAAPPAGMCEPARWRRRHQRCHCAAPWPATRECLCPAGARQGRGCAAVAMWEQHRRQRRGGPSEARHGKRPRCGAGARQQGRHASGGCPGRAPPCPPRGAAAGAARPGCPSMHAAAQPAMRAAVGPNFTSSSSLPPAAPPSRAWPRPPPHAQVLRGAAEAAAPARPTLCSSGCASLARAAPQALEPGAMAAIAHACRHLTHSQLAGCASARARRRLAPRSTPRPAPLWAPLNVTSPQMAGPAARGARPGPWPGGQDGQICVLRPPFALRLVQSMYGVKRNARGSKSTEKGHFWVKCPAFIFCAAVDRALNVDRGSRWRRPPLSPAAWPNG